MMMLMMTHLQKCDSETLEICRSNKKKCVCVCMYELTYTHIIYILKLISKCQFSNLQWKSSRYEGESDVGGKEGNGASRDRESRR